MSERLEKLLDSYDVKAKRISGKGMPKVDYALNGYCIKCNLPIPLSKAFLGKQNRLLCPTCHRPLRVKSRNRKR